MLIGLVVFVLPGCTAAIAAVRSDGGLPRLSLLFAVVTLHQLGMARRSPPMALNTRARLAQGLAVQCILAVEFAVHVALSMGIREHLACAHEKSTLYRNTKCQILHHGSKSSTCLGVDKNGCAEFLRHVYR